MSRETANLESAVAGVPGAPTAHATSTAAAGTATSTAAPTRREVIGTVAIDRDVPYGDGLVLDLYRPVEALVEGSARLPVVVFLHGGGWRVGARTDREAHRQIPLAAQGFAVVSASYRLSGRARFPAQWHDARAAVRWVRTHATEFNLDASRIAAAGASAGGQLASLLGLGGHAFLDGEQPGLSGQVSAAVDAVVAYFPVTDLKSWDIEWRDAPYPPEGSFAWQGAQKRGWPPPARAAELFGVARIEDAPADEVRSGDPRSHIEAAVAAGPVPPFLILHGDKDESVHPDHSQWLHQALKAAGVRSTYLLLEGADHEDAAFGEPAPLGAVAGFLRAALGRTSP